MTSITFKGLLNFTNSQQLAGADSGNCLINSLINNEGQPMQEVLGEVTELFVDNIDQHPYHHHVQPYQIVAMSNDSAEMNAWWRVRCFARFARLPVWAPRANELPCPPVHLLLRLQRRLAGHALSTWRRLQCCLHRSDPSRRALSCQLIPSAPGASHRCGVHESIEQSGVCAGRGLCGHAAAAQLRDEECDGAVGARAGGDHGGRLRPAALPLLAALGRGLHHEDADPGAEVRAPASPPPHASHMPHMHRSATGALMPLPCLVWCIAGGEERAAHCLFDALSMSMHLGEGDWYEVRDSVLSFGIGATGTQTRTLEGFPTAQRLALPSRC